MKIVETATLAPHQKEFVFAVWNKEYPTSLSHASLNDLEKWLATLAEPRHLIALGHNDQMLGWATVFTRDGQRWFAIIVSFGAQRAGLGNQLLEHMKKSEAALNAWVIDNFDEVTPGGRLFLSPMPFYIKHGFEICHGTRFPSDTISAVKIRWRRSEEAH